MVVGKGHPDKYLPEEQINDIVSDAMSDGKLDGQKVLLIVPDHTRTAPIGLMFRSIYAALSDRVKALDVMIALGTHPPMSEAQIYERMSMTRAEHQEKYSDVRFFNHMWKENDALTDLGVIPEEKVEELSDGLFRMEVKLTVNKKILDYDHLMVVGPVFPHEVVGFSGGNKYIFPGIAGKEIIDFFHWLGAVITNPDIIGNKWTPVRRVLDLAASYVPVEKSAFCMVVKGHELAGLYYGGTEEAWSEAADLSDKIHIVYKNHPFHTVLSCAPKMYDDLWTGGKCMYKLEPVLAEGGKLIIYAPHITEISYTHGEDLDKIGYHTRDYFRKQWDKFKDYPWGVLAHSTHVKGIGSYEKGVEKPRAQVILATGIPEERCKKVNLGYMDPDSVDVGAYKDREDEGVLYVPKAGEMLYRVRK